MEILRRTSWSRIQGTKQRVQRILGDCGQWEVKRQCVKGDNCSFRHDINNYARVSTAWTEPEQSRHAGGECVNCVPSARSSWPCWRVCSTTLTKEEWLADEHDPKETDLGSTTTDKDAVMAGSAMATRPINKASPIYSGWSSARWRAMSAWREVWFLAFIAGGRGGVCCGVGLGKIFGLDQQRNWRHFDDTIDDAGIFRGGLQLCQSWQPFRTSSKVSFKIGKATTATSKTRGGGYFQGPSYSIQVFCWDEALMRNYAKHKVSSSTVGWEQIPWRRRSSDAVAGRVGQEQGFRNPCWGQFYLWLWWKWWHQPIRWKKRWMHNSPVLAWPCVDAFILVSGGLTNDSEISTQGFPLRSFSPYFRGEKQDDGYSRDASVHVGPGTVEDEKDDHARLFAIGLVAGPERTRKSKKTFATGLVARPERIRTKWKTCNGTGSCVPGDREPLWLEGRRRPFHPDQGQILNAFAEHWWGSFSATWYEKPTTPSMVMPSSGKKNLLWRSEKTWELTIPRLWSICVERLVARKKSLGCTRGSDMTTNLVVPHAFETQVNSRRKESAAQRDMQPCIYYGNLWKIRGKAKQQHGPFSDQGVCEDEDHLGSGAWTCAQWVAWKVHEQELEELPRDEVGPEFRRGLGSWQWWCSEAQQKIQNVKSGDHKPTAVMKNRLTARFSIVAGDGACPDASSDHQLDVVFHTVPDTVTFLRPVQGPCQTHNERRLRAGMRWVLWSSSE